MKKKVFATLLAVAMVASMVPASVAVQAAEGDTIRLVNGKVEVDAQFKKLAEMYEKETGTKVEIESMGGGVDIQGTLKGYYQSDNMPDIFVNGGSTDFANWDGKLVDMSDQEWASDTDSAYVDDEQGTIGFPYTTEAIGLAYNKDILDKAGIDPATLTGPDAIKKAFETIDSKKDELGITAVVGYCAEPVNLYWSTGQHLFANYFADFVSLLNQYSDPSILVSGTYDQQILNFSSGKYAFVTQGSWIGATMTVDDADAYKEAGNFEVGMIPYAFEDGIDTILTNSPSWFSIYKDGNVEAAEAFLQWLTTDEAQEVLVKEAGFISPFKSCDIVGDDPFAQTITDYQKNEKTSSWHWLVPGMKEGLAQNYTGQVFADFASGSLDEDGFVKTMNQVLQSAYAN